MNVLILGASSSAQGRTHFSNAVGHNLAIGFKNIGCKTFMIEGTDYFFAEGLNIIPRKAFDEKKMKEMHLIIFTRENYIKSFIMEFPFLGIALKEMERKETFPIFAFRFGNPGWYKEFFQSPSSFYYSTGILLPQTFGIAKALINILPNGDDMRKIWVSPMGVPSIIPPKPKHNPFPKTDKVNLVYMGRLRHSPSREGFIMKVMSLLEEFRLYIFPGSFSIGTSSKKYNPLIEEDFSLLKKLFAPAKNIFIMNPVPYGEHWGYLQWADLGFDLTPSFNRKGNGGGNAKLLENMRAGLPTVTEIGITNPTVGTQVDGVVFAKNANSPESYANAVRKASSRVWNRNYIALGTAMMESYERRATEIIDNIGMTTGINLWGI